MLTFIPYQQSHTYLELYCHFVNLLSGDPDLDQVLTVLLSTAMFVGGVLGFILDNTVPGMYVTADMV
jgi:nucleobase transporter 1/2